MIFNSLTFILFIIFVVVIYWSVSLKIRLLLIFSASLFFYGLWRVEFIPLLIFSAFLDFFVAIKIQANYSEKRRKYLLLVSILVNLGLLFYFKYLIFFANSAIGLINVLGYSVDPIMVNIILPLGISFYTFQTISYTIDVYRRKVDAQNDFLLYACYVTFFPQLIAGPILRASEVISQFKVKQKFNWENIAIGIKRIVFGLFLKVFFADNIGTFVDDGFAIAAEDMSALDVWTLAFLFGFQIYFDFSAYSHIAIGSARLFGIKFPENFNFPYIASSPKDFWRRWHISLSSWIRDYLYLPLSGVKLGETSSKGGIGGVIDNSTKKTKALIFSWLIMGLWHGANWTFVLWGAYHAICIYLYRIVSRYKIYRMNNEKFRSILGLSITLPLMMLSWIPFRSETILDTFIMWGKIFIPLEYSYRGMRENSYLVAALVLIGFFINKFLLHIYVKHQVSYRVSLFAESIVYAVMFFFIIIYLRPINQYIYFQF